MITEGKARQSGIIIAMNAPVAALRARSLLFGVLVIPSAGAALMAVQVRFLFRRQRQGDAGLQHRVPADLTLRVRHHCIDYFIRLALPLFLLLARAVMAAASTPMLAAAG